MVELGTQPVEAVTVYGIESQKSVKESSPILDFSLDFSPQEGKQELKKHLSSRHIQMIAIGGAIGSGLFIGSGSALASGGPGNVFCGFVTMGIGIYFTMQALGELASVYPIRGSFSAYSTKFIHPAWGFAMTWNYVMQ